MTRTHSFFALAAALTVTAAAQPVLRWWNRHPLPQRGTAAQAHASQGALRLDATLSHSRPLEGATTYVRYDVHASDATAAESRHQSVQMALVLDRSGSMAGEKLNRARAAALSLVELLGADDQLAVISFGSDVTELGLTAADEAGKARLRGFINQVSESGGTNISGALTQARALLERAPGDATRRVVLVSDGEPTEGLTREDQLVQLASQMHGARVAVSALGVGSDYNGPLMQHLAEHGGGFYAYLNDPERLTQVLQLELNQARNAVARSVRLKLTLRSGAELVQVAGREVIRNGDEVTVLLPDFAPGQSAQAFVELKVPAGEAALQIDAELEFAQADLGLTTLPMVSLSANTTEDVQANQASKDAAVATDCIRAVGATQMVLAAAALERGDRESAFSMLGNVRRLFAMSADSLAGQDAADTQKRWEATHDAAAVRTEALSLTRKKMVNFGMANSY